MMYVKTQNSPAFEALAQHGKAPVVMQILPSLHGGGVEQGVVDMNAAIVKSGGVSIVVSAGGPRVHDIARHGGLHIELSVNSKNPLVMWRNVKRLRKLIIEHDVDVVHACSRAPAWSAAKAVQGTKARYLTSCHAAHKVSNSLKRFYNGAIAGGEMVIAVSEFLGQYLVDNYDLHPSKIRVVHRGLALSKFHPNAVTPQRLIDITQKLRIPDGASVVILPGRLTRGKGHFFLIDALLRLGRDDIFCIFVGKQKEKSPYRGELEKYIAQKGLEGRVRIVDHCDDMSAAYMVSTVVVAPSIVPEGFGRIAIEAQAMGRPVIATDHGGAKETIKADKTGWLVPPGDVEKLTSALQEAFALDANARAVLGTRSMAHVAENFTVEKMCAATLDVYAELLNMSQGVDDVAQQAAE